ncbi:hypothetical protein HP439_01325 [Sphingobacterium shayense]|nr:hypothetical protein [Sphingobacterium shayense]
MDVIAAGQLMPGLVFSSVTFIGYQIGGWVGAVVSTIAIFIPSFIFVALLNPLIKEIRRSKGLSVFLDAANVASISIIAAVRFTMGKEVLVNWRSVVIMVLSMIILFAFKNINSEFLVIGGTFFGFLLLKI